MARVTDKQREKKGNGNDWWGIMLNESKSFFFFAGHLHKLIPNPPPSRHAIYLPYGPKGPPPPPPASLSPSTTEGVQNTFKELYLIPLRPGDALPEFCELVDGLDVLNGRSAGNEDGTGGDLARGKENGKVGSVWLGVFVGSKRRNGSVSTSASANGSASAQRQIQTQTQVQKEGRPQARSESQSQTPPHDPRGPRIPRPAFIPPAHGASPSISSSRPSVHPLSPASAQSQSSGPGQGVIQNEKLQQLMASLNPSSLGLPGLPGLSGLPGLPNLPGVHGGAQVGTPPFPPGGTTPLGTGTGVSNSPPTLPRPPQHLQTNHLNQRLPPPPPTLPPPPGGYRPPPYGYIPTPPQGPAMTHGYGSPPYRRGSGGAYAYPLGSSGPPGPRGPPGPGPLPRPPLPPGAQAAQGGRPPQEERHHPNQNRQQEQGHRQGQRQGQRWRNERGNGNNNGGWKRRGH